MNKTAFGGLLLIVLATALLVRIPGLSLRPMHHDEANQALKFGRLLEKGEYQYDKADHHGPALYYLTLPLAWASSKTTLSSLDETTLRLLPAIFGAALVLLLLLFGQSLGRTACLFAGLFIALSPAFTYYSRFYIQETLFVFFIMGFIGSLWRYRTRPAIGWALAAGFFAGMMYATKETSIIIFITAAGALLLSGIFRKKDPPAPGRSSKALLTHILLALIVAALTTALFFSSFFRNPKGILDSVLAFQNYLTKSGEPGFHAHPLWYYLGLLTYSKSAGLVWGEALVMTLACLGILSALKNRGPFPVFISLYTLFTTAVFSVISYKTPWNVLPFYIGFVILAGIGTVFILQSLRKNYQKILIGLLLAAGIINLEGQSYEANFRYFADPRNPYVYAQTSTDFLKLVRRVEETAAFHPDHERMLIKVVCGPYETWPLPWYLRRYERVGYWSDWRDVGGFDDALLVIASQDQAEKIRPAIRDKFQSEYYGLRPDVLLTLFIRNDLWDRFMKDKRQ